MWKKIKWAWNFKPESITEILFTVVFTYTNYGSRALKKGLRKLSSTRKKNVNIVANVKNAQNGKTDSSTKKKVSPPEDSSCNLQCGSVC